VIQWYYGFGGLGSIRNSIKRDKKNIHLVSRCRDKFNIYIKPIVITVFLAVSGILRIEASFSGFYVSFLQQSGGLMVVSGKTVWIKPKKRGCIQLKRIHNKDFDRNFGEKR